VVVLVAAMRHGPSSGAVRELTELFGADRRTIARWCTFWREYFPQTRSEVKRGRFIRLAIVDLPRALFETFIHRADSRETGSDYWSFSHRSRLRGPGDQGKFLKDSGPQEMLVEPPDGADYIWSHSRFSPRVLVAKGAVMTKHPTHPPLPCGRFRFSVVGALLKRACGAREIRAAIDALACQDLDASSDRTRRALRGQDIERWLYRARREQDDPAAVLPAAAVRKTAGRCP